MSENLPISSVAPLSLGELPLGLVDPTNWEVHKDNITLYLSYKLGEKRGAFGSSVSAKIKAALLRDVEHMPEIHSRTHKRVPSRWC